MTTKKLSPNRKQDGYQLTMVTRNAKAAIYALDTGRHWEVVKVRTRIWPKNWEKELNTNDPPYTHMEVYPSSFEWGIIGFTHTSLEAAIKKFNEISEDT